MSIRPGPRTEKTEAFLRWVEAQAELPRSFALPTPAQAGLLAAVRLRYTDYIREPITGELALVKQCEAKGWLEVRPAKPVSEAHPRRRVPPGHEEQVKLTPEGRLVLDAILEAGWPVAAPRVG